MGRPWDEKEKQIVREVYRTGETDAEAFRTAVEKRSGCSRTLAAYQTFLYKQAGEDWTDVPQLLMNNLLRARKQERQSSAAERATRTSQTKDAIVHAGAEDKWLTANEASERFGITPEQVRRRCVIQKLVRRIENADGHFLYSERDLMISGYPMRRGARNAAVSAARAASTPPLITTPAKAVVAPTTGSVAMPPATLSGRAIKTSQPSSELSEFDRTVLDLAHLLRDGVLTRDQVADALARLPGVKS